MPTRLAPPVTLQQILDRRESRAQRQRALLTAYPGATLLCLLVNLPGPVKRTNAGDRVFAAGHAALCNTLKNAGITPLYTETLRSDTGCEAMFVVEANAEACKRLTCALESELPYGRLLDIDVHAPDGTQLSRTMLSLPERGCMVCGKAGAYCASRRAHPLPELLVAFDALAQTAPMEDGL